MTIEDDTTILIGKKRHSRVGPSMFRNTHYIKLSNCEEEFFNKK
jgi:hypothetical protein